MDVSDTGSHVSHDNNFCLSVSWEVVFAPVEHLLLLTRKSKCPNLSFSEADVHLLLESKKKGRILVTMYRSVTQQSSANVQSAS